MDNADIRGLLGLLVGAVSALIAWDAKEKEYQANKRSDALAEKNNELAYQANELQERLVRIEEKRDTYTRAANRQAEFHIQCHVDRLTTLIIKNIGRGGARDLRVTLNRKDIQSHPALKTSDIAELGYKIDQGGVFQFVLDLRDYVPKPSLLYFAWFDEVNEKQTATFELETLC